jgi:hypothetical protein
MRTRPGHFLVAPLLLALVGCGGAMKDPVEVVCDLHFSCDCEPTNYADKAACVADLEARYTEIDDAARAIASANGLTFDQECVDQGREVPGDLGCDLARPESDACFACAIVHGAQPLGAGCTQKDIYSDCARDLVCYMGLCADPCQRLAAGANCVGGSSLATCDKGLFCDAGNTNKCQPNGGVGSPCPTLAGCDEKTYCAADLTCQAYPAAGEPCTDDGMCADDLYCTAAKTCAVIPGDGQPCEDRCQEYLVCTAGMCKPGPAVGEPCPVNGPCGPGAVCEGDTCVAEQPLVCGIKPNVE